MEWHQQDGNRHRATVGAALVWSLDFSGTGVFGAGDALYTFGKAGSIPVVGDWSGTGTTKIGTYAPDPNGVGLDFSLDTGGTGSFAVPPDQVDYFGLAGDWAFVGDWTGTGKTKIGTYRYDTATQSFLFSMDTNGDGTFDSGDVVSSTGFPAPSTAQVFVGQWKDNPKGS